MFNGLWLTYLYTESKQKAPFIARLTELSQSFENIIIINECSYTLHNESLIYIMPILWCYNERI